jgi:hypothetical protein
MTRWQIAGLLGILVVSNSEALLLNKCCPEGQLLDLNSKECIQDQGLNGRDNVVRVKIFKGTTNFEGEEDVHLNVPNQPFHNCSLSNRRNLKEFYAVHPGEDNPVLILLKGPEIFPSFCIDRNNIDNDDTVVIQVCDTCTEEKMCLSFCCGEDKFTTGGKCVSTDNNNFAEWYNNLNIQYTRVHSNLQCSEPAVYPPSLYRIANGAMIVDELARDHSEYCIRHVMEKDTPVTQVLLCTEDDDNTLKITLMTLSDISLLIMLVIHILIPELRKHHFGYMKMAFFSCLFVFFFILIITSIGKFNKISIPLCLFFGFINQYFSLATFFWLTCMSLEIWRFFRKLRNPLQEDKRVRLRLTTTFFVISFCCPALITLVTISMQLQPLDVNTTFISPGIENHCSLDQYKPQFFYFQLIVAILLLINATLFLSLVHSFVCGVWTTSCRLNRSTKINRKKQNCKIVFELFIIMGISWISGFINFMIGWTLQREWNHPILWVFNSVNWLNGVFILLAFLSRDNNRTLLKERFFSPEPKPPSNSSSSQKNNTMLTDIAAISPAPATPRSSMQVQPTNANQETPGTGILQPIVPDVSNVSFRVVESSPVLSMSVSVNASLLETQESIESADTAVTTCSHDSSPETTRKTEY